MLVPQEIHLDKSFTETEMKLRLLLNSSANSKTISMMQLTTLNTGTTSLVKVTGSNNALNTSLLMVDSLEVLTSKLSSVTLLLIELDSKWESLTQFLTD